jgi:transcription elongation factor Elf1
MRCPKCAGLLLTDQAADLCFVLYQVFCLNCGWRQEVGHTPLTKPLHPLALTKPR